MSLEKSILVWIIGACVVVAIDAQWGDGAGYIAFFSLMLVLYLLGKMIP